MMRINDLWEFSRRLYSKAYVPTWSICLGVSSLVLFFSFLVLVVIAPDNVLRKLPTGIGYIVVLSVITGIVAALKGSVHHKLPNDPDMFEAIDAFLSEYSPLDDAAFARLQAGVARAGRPTFELLDTWYKAESSTVRQHALPDQRAREQVAATRAWHFPSLTLEDKSRSQR